LNALAKFILSVYDDDQSKTAILTSLIKYMTEVIKLALNNPEYKNAKYEEAINQAIKAIGSRIPSIQQI
jgi:hypothetical protein